MQYSHYVPSGFSEKIFKERYAIDESESFYEACVRVASAIGEDGDKKAEYFEQLVSGKFCPGGRIWYACNRPKSMLLNCFTASVEDSREGWGKTVSDTIVISGTGGGVGINFSPIRYRGAKISGHSGTATGAASLMQIVNSAGNIIRAGGGRRTALMFCLEHDHPDIMEFLDSKLKHNVLNNANISVVFMSESIETFLKKVQNNELHNLIWNGNVVKSIPAKELWDKIINNAVLNGEPGILNGYLANQENNLWYEKKLTSTNPCVTGDTVIATVDGPKTFKELADSGEDVLVYAWNPETKVPVIRWMKNPRMTRGNSELVEVEFDSGLKVRCTLDHNFYSFRGYKVKAKNLKIGKSIRAWSMSVNRGHLRIHGWDSENNCSNHRWVGRAMWECFYGEPSPENVIHHKNENKQDNRIENLELIKNNSEHNKIHYPKRFANVFDGRNKNHKIIGIRKLNYTEDVYSGTVDDVHTYIILDPHPICGISSGIVSANCSELWLEPYGCCDLGSLVLPNFIINGEFDWETFDGSIRSAVGFLDRVLDVNTYPLQEIKDNCLATRRIGLGVMGLHDAMLMLGLKYSSTEGRSWAGSVLKRMRDVAYRESIELAQAKGSFSLCDRFKFIESGFCKRLPEDIRQDIVKYGIRNCTLLTIAPTGTTSIMMGVSSGIEPVYAFTYKRRYFNGLGVSEEEIIEHPLFAKLKNTSAIDNFESALDISPENHILMQVELQQYVDNSISKTINLPKAATVEDVEKVLVRYVDKLKGVTVYRDGSRGESPIEPAELSDVETMMNLACVGGTCDL